MERTTDSVFLEDEHRILRDQIRRFVTDRIAPHVDEWETAKTFPRELYAEFGAQGFLGIGASEEYGGAGGDIFHVLVMTEELIRSGSPGLAASLGSLFIAAPPIVHGGTAEQKQRWLPKAYAGVLIGALGVTEPSGGSDVANLKTRAVRDGDEYVINGSKTFITSGTRADFVTIAARTGGEGAGGISVFVVETDRPGFRVGSNLQKMGWHASDTAELFFEDLRVPVDNRIGPENGGFFLIMQNFATERLVLAATCCEIAQLAWEESVKYTKERSAFGRNLEGFQVIRHKLADMATRIQTARAMTYTVAARFKQGHPCVAEVAMAKNAATDMCSAVVDQAVQIHGGYGYMHGYLVERLYRDARLYPIGGGTREIMNEVISKWG